MKKFKIGTSFLLFVIISILTKSFLLMLNYFVALTLHELAHLFVATRRGYSLKLLKLDIFGMSLELSEKIDDRDSFAINIAGPVFNLSLCLICVSMYWLVPISFFYLNSFCLCNLVLAIFNLLPIYPLDGGKIFCGIIKSDKMYKVLDCAIRYVFSLMCICAFFITYNLMFVIVSIFFIFSKGRKAPSLSIFKNSNNKHLDKVVILKVDENTPIFDLIKKINSHTYTIFYVPTIKRYFDEDEIVLLATKYKLTTEISKCN